MNFKGNIYKEDVNGPCPYCHERACSCCCAKIYTCQECKRNWVIHQYCVDKLGWAQAHDKYTAMCHECVRDRLLNNTN